MWMKLKKGSGLSARPQALNRAGLVLHTQLKSGYRSQDAW
jgi:hypothetical protein